MNNKKKEEEIMNDIILNDYTDAIRRTCDRISKSIKEQGECLHNDTISIDSKKTICSTYRSGVEYGLSAITAYSTLIDARLSQQNIYPDKTPEIMTAAECQRYNTVYMMSGIALAISIATYIILCVALVAYGVRHKNDTRSGINEIKAAATATTINYPTQELEK
jgi:hypothetical protein